MERLVQRAYTYTMMLLLLTMMMRWTAPWYAFETYMLPSVREIHTPAGDCSVGKKISCWWGYDAIFVLEGYDHFEETSHPSPTSWTELCSRGKFKFVDPSDTLMQTLVEPEQCEVSQSNMAVCAAASHYLAIILWSASFLWTREPQGFNEDNSLKSYRSFRSFLTGLLNWAYYYKQVHTFFRNFL
jgi:hypothetical protein